MEDKNTNQKVNTGTADIDKLKGEAVLSLLFMLLSVWIMAESVDMSKIIRERTGAEIYTLPGIFPFIIACLVFFCSLAVIINAARKGIRRSSFSLRGTLEKIKSEEMCILGIIVLSMIIYVTVLIPFIPFEIATFFFVFFLFMIFKAAVWWKSLIISFLFSALVVWFFAEVVRTPFPHSFF